MSRFVYPGLILLLLSVPAATADLENLGKADTSFKVLWDGAFTADDCSLDKAYTGLRDELQRMGALITKLGSGGRFTDQILEGFDIVIMCDRWGATLADEQKALVRYVKAGGSLLAICGSGTNGSALNPILINFGVKLTETYTGISKINLFVHPATTERRPVELCYVDGPRKIECSGKAMAIAGRNTNGSPASIVGKCYMALGGKSGKGRVIATGDQFMWANYWY